MKRQTEREYRKQSRPPEDLIQHWLVSGDASPLPKPRFHHWISAGLTGSKTKQPTNYQDNSVDRDRLLIVHIILPSPVNYDHSEGCCDDAKIQFMLLQ